MSRAEQLTSEPFEPATPVSPSRRLSALPGSGSFDKHNPRHLLILFAAIALLSILAILLLAGYGVHRIYSNEKIREAQQAAVAVGSAIFVQERELLSSAGSGGLDVVAVKRQDFETLDQRMRNYLPPFHVFKIKVYSRDKTIVYSTDRSIIGKVDDDNAMLDQVLQNGEVNSRLQTKDHISDLAGETRLDVDVVETYLPIRVGNTVIGSFEIYKDVTPARERVTTVLASSGLVLFAALTVVFGGLFLLMRKGATWLERAQEELRALAAIDTLTGIFNRRHLMSRIEEEYSRMLRESRKAVKHHCLSFIMIDIDHFKTINDAYGHIAGDDILRAVSARLKTGLRAYDVIGRYGGEEFLATLPHTDIEDARQVAERMHQAVRAYPFEVNGAAVSVTVSVGVARSEDGEDDMLPALRRADDNLYRAKSGGRDRVCV